MLARVAERPIGTRAVNLMGQQRCSPRTGDHRIPVSCDDDATMARIDPDPSTTGGERQQHRDSWLAGEQLAAIANAMTGLHRRYYGRGATKARTYQVHPELVLVELRDVYLTVERTLLERGQQNTVRQTRLTFQQAMYNEFVGAVERIAERKVRSYESVVITCPELLIEIFYLESLAEREERVEREAREDAGEIERPEGGIPH
jgi:uncharacterized protein YbcI